MQNLHRESRSESRGESRGERRGERRGWTFSFFNDDPGESDDGEEFVILLNYQGTLEEVRAKILTSWDLVFDYEKGLIHSGDEYLDLTPEEFDEMIKEEDMLDLCEVDKMRQMLECGTISFQCYDNDKFAILRPYQEEDESLNQLWLQ